MTRREAETLRVLRQENDGLHGEYGRYSRALGELMRDIALELADPIQHPTSIASGRLIRALAKANETLHAGRTHA